MQDNEPRAYIVPEYLPSYSQTALQRRRAPGQSDVLPEEDRK